MGLVSDEVVPVTPGAAGDQAAKQPTVPERRVFWALAALATVMVALAVLLNWYSVVHEPGVAASGQSGAGGPSLAVVTLSKSPTAMLPGDIIGYENMALHGVPGQEKTAAEALYQTTDMRIEQQLPLGAYARVEGFASPADATSQVQSIMAQYPLKRHEVLANDVTPVSIGYSKDEGTWVAAWATGQYVVTVKSYFLDHIPATKLNFLDIQGTQIMAAVDVYQRTGEQGVQAQALIKAPLPETLGAQTGLAQPGTLGSP